MQNGIFIGIIYSHTRIFTGRQKKNKNTLCWKLYEFWNIIFLLELVLNDLSVINVHILSVKSQL